MPTSFYFLDIRHEGLHAYRRISGRDPGIVQARADAQVAVWNEKWARTQQRDRAVRTKEGKKESATRQTQQATEAIAGIDNTLTFALSRSSVFDWSSVKDTSQFAKPKPVAPTKQAYPPSPSSGDLKYEVTLNILDHVIASRKRAKKEGAQRSFESDVSAWKAACKLIDDAHSAAESAHQAQLKAWETEKIAFGEAQTASHAEIDAQKAAYLAKAPEAVADYCDLVLTTSEYPDSFPKSWRLDYNPETRLLVVEYSLPNLEALPRLKEVKYVATRNELVESLLQDSVLEKMYDGLIYKIALRTLHELFEADVADAIQAVVFNGWVNAVDKATGQEINGCIVSVQVAKEEFSTIHLAKVDPKACFKKLKGVGSSKLAALVPIRPILQLDTADARFVPSYDVAAGLDNSMNLAAMDWEDFEHLIREIFEREFSNGGSEVKITRASRDGGVDAVVFDPDPLRGGKIVIQAKRYTNTVGVSAVRDLYGTVMNEGANKGILVTTADYGPDAYEFAKDKPLTLLSGSNLLHLLEKHGHHARIDLREAKTLLQATAK
jgi:restriction system protein